MDEAALRALRGPGIATVFQDPVAHLHPAMRIGAQIMAALRAHHPEMGSGGLRARVLAALAAARMPDPEAAAQAWPHQLSGGLAQRALIAMALAQAPALLIADEPTTALDPPVAAAILDLLHARARQDGMALLLISHDLDQLAARADRLAVMYAGRIVEEAPTELLFADPQHPYTLGLLASMPRPGPPEPFASIPGTVPRPGAWPSGCRFRTRCPFAVADCASVDPALREVAAGHFAACIRAPL
jgi:oligopeptide/dipeptide ABC transporter ATP-binding protein